MMNQSKDSHIIVNWFVYARTKFSSMSFLVTEREMNTESGIIQQSGCLKEFGHDNPVSGHQYK